MKSCKGIVILELIIVIICIVLISGFAIYDSTKNIKKSQATELYEEFVAIKNAVDTVIVRRVMEDSGESYYNNFGDAVVPDEDGYLFVYGKDEAGYKNSGKRFDLGVPNLKRSYKVNFIDPKNNEIRLKNSVTLPGGVIITSYSDIYTFVTGEEL